VAPAVHPLTAPASHSASTAAPPPAAPVETQEELHAVKSPIVGTFYESPSPGSPPFVKVGDMVEAGQILCIIEAMKLMNEIESDLDGVVEEILVSNGQPVEYNEVLFRVRPAAG